MNFEKHPRMTTDQVAAYVDAASILLDIDLPAEYRPSIVANLERLLQLGLQIMDFPLPENTELAPVFQP